MKIKLLLNEKLTCMKWCFQDLSPDLRHTKFADGIDRAGPVEFLTSFLGLVEVSCIYPELVEFPMSSLAGGSFYNQLHVPRDRARSRSSKPTINSGGSSH